MTKKEEYYVLEVIKLTEEKYEKRSEEYWRKRQRILTKLREIKTSLANEDDNYTEGTSFFFCDECLTCSNAISGCLMHGSCEPLQEKRGKMDQRLSAALRNIQ